ncbi:hypothetical protein DTO271G3_2273 [Paecilomyces variotii]|nr:hypothetical protein DTO271G3_2273 [Paecilomyces variotii]
MDGQQYLSEEEVPEAPAETVDTVEVDGGEFVWEELDRCARSVVTVKSPSAAGWLSSEKMEMELRRCWQRWTLGDVEPVCDSSDSSAEVRRPRDGESAANNAPFASSPPPPWTWTETEIDEDPQDSMEILETDRIEGAV